MQEIQQLPDFFAVELLVSNENAHRLDRRMNRSHIARVIGIDATLKSAIRTLILAHYAPKLCVIDIAAPVRQTHIAKRIVVLAQKSIRRFGVEGGGMPRREQIVIIIR